MATIPVPDQQAKNSNKNKHKNDLALISLSQLLSSEP